MTEGFSRFKASDYLNHPEFVSEYIKTLEEEITAQAERIKDLEAHILKYDINDSQFRIILEEHDENQRYRKKLRLRIKELETALEKERERCAKIAEKIYYPNEGKMIAKEIRESGK